MPRHPPRSTSTYTLFPCAPLVRSPGRGVARVVGPVDPFRPVRGGAVVHRLDERTPDTAAAGVREGEQVLQVADRAEQRGAAVVQIMDQAEQPSVVLGEDRKSTRLHSSH